MPHIPYELPFEVTLPLGEGRLWKGCRCGVDLQETLSVLAFRVAYRFTFWSGDPLVTPRVLSLRE